MVFDGIDITNPKWRALHVQDVDGMEYLGKMLRQGWYISPFGMDDIGYMVLTVPANTPKRINFTTEHHLLDAQQQPSLTIVVLHKGGYPDRQMVVVHPRDESGYVVRGEKTPSFTEWKLIATFPLIDGSIGNVYEMRQFSDE